MSSKRSSSGDGVACGGDGGAIATAAGIDDCVGDGGEGGAKAGRSDEALSHIRRQLDSLLDLVKGYREDVRAVIRRLDDADRPSAATTRDDIAIAATAADLAVAVAAPTASTPLAAAAPTAAVWTPQRVMSGVTGGGFGGGSLSGLGGRLGSTGAEAEEGAAADLRRMRRRALKQIQDEDAEDGGDIRAAAEPKMEERVPLLERVFGICAPDNKLGKVGSRVIHPTSIFNTGMMGISGVFLIYSMLLVPMELSFWLGSDPCSIYMTTYCDMVVDSFFIMEIMINFFTGYLEEGVYIDDIGKIAKRYLTTPSLFTFDFFTSVPFSYYDYWVYQNCGFATGNDRPGTDGRLIRLCKPLRILKLLRILKTMRVMAWLDDEMSYWMGPIFVKLLRLAINVVVSVHLFCCAYWRVKLDSNPDDVVAFLESKNVEPGVLCFYFVFTVFSTVGFGEIVATNTSERIFCIFLFLAGSSLFGTIISQLNDILQTMTRESREMDLHMMGYHTFMNTYRVPREVESTITQWVRFQFTEELADRQKRDVLADKSLPEQHRLALASSLRLDLFFQIPFLANIPERIRSMFSAEVGQLLLRAENIYYSPETVTLARTTMEFDAFFCNTQTSQTHMIICDSSDRANCLMILDKGHVEMCLPVKEGGGVLRVLRRGDLFGDCHIVGDNRWAGSWGIEADFVAKTMCSIICISASDLQRIIRRFDFTFIRRRIERGCHCWRLWEEEREQRRKKRSPDQGPMKPKVVFLWVDAARRLLNSVRAGPISSPISNRRSSLTDNLQAERQHC